MPMQASRPFPSAVPIRNESQHTNMNPTSTKFSPSLLTFAAIVMTMAATSARAQYKAQILTVPEAPTGDIIFANQISANGQLVLLTAENPVTDLNDGTYIYNTITHKVATLPQDPDAVPGTVSAGGLNDLGDVAGVELSATATVPPWAAIQGWVPERSFVYSSITKTYTNYDPAAVLSPPGINTEANDINDFGQIAGAFENGGGSQGYLLSDIRRSSQEGAYKVLDVLPEGPINMSDTFEGFSGGTTQANGLNNLGQVVGYYTTIPTNLVAASTDGFVWGPLTGFKTINVPGNVDNVANGINDEGVIVGSTYNPLGTTFGDGFIYNHGAFSIYDFPGSAFTELEGISDGGAIVGVFEDEDGTIGAFMLTPEGPGAGGHN